MTVPASHQQHLDTMHNRFVTSAKQITMVLLANNIVLHQQHALEMESVLLTMVLAHATTLQVKGIMQEQAVTHVPVASMEQNAKTTTMEPLPFQVLLTVWN